MINITYLAANDPFHAVFRMFVLFPDDRAQKCKREHTRILDFYVCFPFLISEFKPPRSLVKSHNALKRRYLPNTYQVTPKPAIMFHRMQAPFGAASSSLQSFGFFDRDAFVDGFFCRTKKQMPERIFEVVEEYRQENADLVRFLDELKEVSIYGPNGLRARSKLEEYRYDDV